MPAHESLFHKQAILCPHCGLEEPATIWDGINARTDPDLKERLLRKRLQSHVCANCGLDFILAEPLVYHDPALRLLVVVIPDAAPEERAPEADAAPRYDDPAVAARMARAACGFEPAPADGYTLRMVPDYNHLIEKIHLADHGRDDRLIEVLKVAIRRNPTPGKPTSGIAEILYAGEQDEEMCFMIRDGEGAWFQLELDAALYSNAARVMGGALGPEGQWAVIDTAYAVDLINRLS